MTPNMTYNMIKTQFFFHQALHYGQIYNFTFNHEYKFKTIIVFKDIRILKSKRVYVFFFWMFWTHGSILVEYIKIHKKIENIWWTFNKGKKLLMQKNYLFTCFLQCFKHIKQFLKHSDFHENFVVSTLRI
jgi:hypothetical protein